MLGENNVVGEFQILFKVADCLRRVMVLVLEHGGIVVVVNHCQHSRLVLSHEFALHAPLLIWFDISLMALRVEVNHLVEVHAKCGSIKRQSLRSLHKLRVKQFGIIFSHLMIHFCKLRCFRVLQSLFKQSGSTCDIAFLLQCLCLKNSRVLSKSCSAEQSHANGK